MAGDMHIRIGGLEPPQEPQDGSGATNGVHTPVAALSPVEPVQTPLAPLMEPDVYSRDIVGPMDSWVGRVLAVHNAAADDHTGLKNTIQVERIRVFWGTNHAPESETGTLPGSKGTQTAVTAYPWPLKHDQETHHAAAGDYVMVLDGRDGRYWYMVDDTPFIGQIIAVDGVAVDEAHNNGAGNLLLTVEQQSLSGGPGSLSLADLNDADSVTVEHTNVYANPGDTLHHGWRVGDKVWVERRGAYLFCWQHRETFIGKIVVEGPNSEADFTDERYWVEEQQTAATWSTNSAAYTISTRAGDERIVAAGNLSEYTAGTHTLAAGTYVVVILQADPADGEPVYMFTAGEPGASGTHDSEQTMLPSTFELNDDEVTDTWDITDQGNYDGVIVRLQTRMSYDHNEDDPQLYAYHRTFTFDSLGALVAISAETQVTVDDTDPCVVE